MSKIKSARFWAAEMLRLEYPIVDMIREIQIQARDAAIEFAADEIAESNIPELTPFKIRGLKDHENLKVE